MDAFGFRASAFFRISVFGFRILVPLLLAGCAVGPNFKRPAAPDVNGYTPAPLSTTEGVTNVLGGEPQRFLSGTNIPGEWWTLFTKGYVSRLDVAAQESQLTAIVATLPPLRKQLARQRDLLAVLSGGFPSKDLPEKFELSALQLPQELPVSIPSQDANGLTAAAAARDAAKITLDLSVHQWQSGYASYLALLSAEQAYNQAVINLIQAQANRYADTAALFLALGGGWWNRVELAKN